MTLKGNIYFASDLHLGIPNREASLEREKAFVRWLDMVSADAAEIYLLGDIFDFWFEYKKVVPRGYTRLFGKLAELTDGGLPIYIFTGNHDLWLKDYFSEELGIPVYKEAQIRTFQNKKFFLAHGDGLGPGDRGYKMMKKVFTNPLCQFAFRQLHPDFAAKTALFFSRKSRDAQAHDEVKFLGIEDEWLCQYALRKLEKEHFDYFVFGHRHTPVNIDLNKQSKYCNLGDWIKHRSYAKFDGESLSVLFFEP